MSEIKSEIEKAVKGYDRENITIATIGSHTALQILKGAKELGFKTLVVCKKRRDLVYRRFRVADEVISVNDYSGVVSKEVVEKLREKNSIVIPHGSFVEYVEADKIENNFAVPIFGNRNIMRWEADREKEREWFEKANIKQPKIFTSPEQIDRLCIIKFPGARGGRDYFVVKNERTFWKKTRALLEAKKITQEDVKRVTIQEYVSGVNLYVSYFSSFLNNDVEIFGMDRRYETNIDGLTRISALDQLEVYGDAKFEPSYVVAGNFPLVARESLLDKMFKMGDSVVKISKEICPPGLFGPFCLELMVNHNLDLIVFEISARIVAGTNPYIDGSPYSYLLYGNNMSMGKRIALEIKTAIEKDKLEEVVT